VKAPRLTRPVVAVTAVGALLVTGGGIAVANSVAGSSNRYRTAEVTTADVDSTMSLSGTVTASSRRDLTFGTSGTVAAVKVEAGQTVKSGDVLARLDTADLDAAVTKAEATLADARARLESDRSSQSSTVAAATSQKASGQKKTGAGGQPGTADLEALKRQQEAVTTAQTAATEAIAAAKAAVTTRVAACQEGENGEAPDPAACADALSAAQTAQDAVAQKQDALQQALEELAKTLAAAAEALGKTDGTSAQPGGSASTGSTGTGSTGTGSGTPRATATAATLAQDQAAIDTARAQLKEAKLARKAATLTAPFAGTVLDVSVARGDSVSATDTAVILVGDGGSVVTTTVTVDQVAKVQKGHKARITPAGFDEPVEGVVTAIGMLPTSGDDTTSYPVTIDLSDDVRAPEGAGASIALVTGTADDAIVVPTSAVSSVGSRFTVTVLTDGKPVPTQVTVGVVGSTLTQITQGVKTGQAVVIADLDAALPSSGSTSQRTFGNGGGFPGGSFRGPVMMRR